MRRPHQSHQKASMPPRASESAIPVRTFHKQKQQQCRLLVRVHSADQLRYVSSNGAYCKLYVAPTDMIQGNKSHRSSLKKRFMSMEDEYLNDASHCRIVKTQVQKENRLQPVWKEKFEIVVNDPELEILTVRVKTTWLMSTHFVGACSIPLSTVQTETLDQWIPLINGTRAAGRIRLQLRLLAPSGVEFDSRLTMPRDHHAISLVFHHPPATNGQPTGVFQRGSIRNAARRDSVNGAMNMIRAPSALSQQPSSISEESPEDPPSPSLPLPPTKLVDVAAFSHNVPPVSYGYASNQNALAVQDSMATGTPSRVPIGSQLLTVLDLSPPLSPAVTAASDESLASSPLDPSFLQNVDDLDDTEDEEDSTSQAVRDLFRPWSDRISFGMRDSDWQEQDLDFDALDDEDLDNQASIIQEEEEEEEESDLLANLTSFDGDSAVAKRLMRQNPTLCQLLQQKSCNVLMDDDEADDEDDGTILTLSDTMRSYDDLVPILEELRHAVDEIDCA